MSLPDSFYLALCMTILLVGSVYWVWTQIQYVQRKVNALENIVYELKTLCSRQEQAPPLPTVSYPPAPPSEIGEEDADLLEESLRKEIEEPMILQSVSEDEVDAIDTIEEEKPMETRTIEFDLEAKSEENLHPLMQEMPEDDLQPGGVGSGTTTSYTSSLESMSVKELRRLAAQKGISGAGEMKKKDLITAIRSIPIESFLE
jgi:hypothetical protein